MAKKPSKNRQGLTSADIKLWQGVTETIQPLATKSFSQALEELEQNPPVSDTRMASTSPEAPHSVGVKGFMERPKGREALGTSSKAVKPQARSFDEGYSFTAAKQIQKIDRKTKAKIAKGRLGLDGRLDLHGMTQSEAHAALRNFLGYAHQKGSRTVLVITGKGGREGNFGVLRQSLPRWLAEPAFRQFVSGVEEAALAHGGEGAFYIRIKRRV